MTVLDVRLIEEYNAAHIPGALSIPLKELKLHLDGLPRGQEIVAYCRGPFCVLSIQAVQIPTRIAIGSNLAIVLLSSMAGFIGKATTGQIEWLMAVPIVLAVIPAARIGSLVSRRVPVFGLRRVLAILIAIAAIRIWASVLL